MSFNVVSFGADLGGTSDSSPAIQAAIDAAKNAGGGTVFFPTGTYLLKGVKVSSGGVDDDILSGFHVPFLPPSERNSPVGEGRQTTLSGGISLVGEGRQTILKAGPGRMFVVRFSGSFSSMAGFRIDGNEISTGIAVVGERTDVDLPGHKQSHNSFRDLLIQHCENGILLQAPDSERSSCDYNTFNNIHVFFQQNAINGQRGRGVYFRGNNRSKGNSFVQCMFGRLNTGVEIESAEKGTFMACSFEDIQTGMSAGSTQAALPHSIPTAIRILGKPDKRLTNRFIGCTSESAFLAFSTELDGSSELYGCNLVQGREGGAAGYDQLIAQLQKVSFCVGGLPPNEMPVLLDQAMRYVHEAKVVTIGGYTFREDDDGGFLEITGPPPELIKYRVRV